MQNIDSNQTQFSEVTPVFESGVAPMDVTKPEVEVKPKAKSKKMMIVGVVALVFVLVFVGLLIMIAQSLQKGPLNGGDDNPFVEQKNGEIDPLLQEIYDLDDQLQAADPSIDEIPLPPVDMGLRLDPAKKK